VIKPESSFKLKQKMKNTNLHMPVQMHMKKVKTSFHVN